MRFIRSWLIAKYLLPIIYFYNDFCKLHCDIDFDENLQDK